jgi:hypothetical protein
VAIGHSATERQSRPCADAIRRWGTSCMPASLIADPLYADSENNNHYRSEGNPKDR